MIQSLGEGAGAGDGSKTLFSSFDDLKSVCSRRANEVGCRDGDEDGRRGEGGGGGSVRRGESGCR